MTDTVATNTSILPSGIEFRVARESDAVEISSLVNSAYRPGTENQGWTHEAALVAGDRTSALQVLSCFSKDSTVLTLVSEGNIIACVHVQRQNQTAYIGMLATSPDYQTLGLGKKMLSLAERYASSEFNVRSFKMSVLASRSELVAFYERRGYRRTGQFEDYPVGAGVGQPLQEGLQVEILTKTVPASKDSFS